jgi:replicative DNA helicase
MSDEQNIPLIRMRQGELLAAMLCDQSLAEKGVALLRDCHFTTAKAKKIFTAIREMVAAGEPLDVSTVAERVEGVTVFDLAKIMETAYGRMGPTHFDFLVTRHIEDHQRIEAAAFLMESAKTIGERDSAVTQELASTISGLTEIQNRIPKTAAKTPEEIAGAEILRIAEQGHKRRFSFWQQERLTHITGGIGAGEFVVLAARPSVGKTTMALNWSHWFCREGAVCAFFSLEMSSWEITRSLMRITSREPLPRDATPCQLRAAAEGLRGLDVRIEEASGATAPLIASRIRQLHREKRLDIVFIDYLQRIRGNGNGKSRYEDMSAISSDITDLAHSSGITVVALAQLNRGMEQRSDKRPRMSDLRESGQIEQDADQIILLSSLDNASTAAVMNGYSVVTAEIAKNRTGPVGAVDFCFNKNTGVFQEIQDP